MSHKIVTNRWRKDQRIVQHVFAGPNAALRRRRRVEWVCTLALFAVAVTLAWVAR